MRLVSQCLGRERQCARSYPTWATSESRVVLAGILHPHGFSIQLHISNSPLCSSERWTGLAQASLSRTSITCERSLGVHGLRTLTDTPNEQPVPVCSAAAGTWGRKKPDLQSHKPGERGDVRDCAQQTPEYQDELRLCWVKGTEVRGYIIGPCACGPRTPMQIIVGTYLVKPDSIVKRQESSSQGSELCARRRGLAPL
ncbi:hypothetical protein BGZ61DRAFT_557341 [Ilyonectria robusta]|uniref:uncharacterized protein n=1 Tax=Ilyonectria robusta TaxID=1079257 RepID=UPI001E8D2EB5|nr:uncharacterized protein BGZ61DRAFT_557341 [Ilyonectria robusta]KAH8670030.1 hypothetical protein BGZ61DRAFT_557341 [Ilyonectria robusta]